MTAIKKFPSKYVMILLLAISVTSEAGVSERLSYSYYNINPDSTHSLRNTLNASSPIRQHGNTFHAYTSWDVKWNFRWFQSASGSCKISSVNTMVTGNIQLPKLVGGTGAQKKQFDKYLAALRSHELGHFDFGKEAAREIDRKITTLPEKSSCTELETVANNLGNQVLASYKEKEIQYDKTTGHGKTQGAKLDE